MKIFLSSTYCDLRHARRILGGFIEGLGYQPVCFERGDIYFDNLRPLDMSCYRDASRADIFLLLVGSRYGSPSSGDAGEKYDSITKREYLEAAKTGLRIYVFVDQSVDAEFKTFERHSDKENFSPVHVDSIDVYRFLQKIHEDSKETSAVITTFSDYFDIQNWLRRQLAGMVDDLLRDRYAAKTVMSEVENFLKEKDFSASAQEKVVDMVRSYNLFRLHLTKILIDTCDLDPEEIIGVFSSSTSLEDWAERIGDIAGVGTRNILELFQRELPGFLDEVNAGREALEKSPFPPSDIAELLAAMPIPADD